MTDTPTMPHGEFEALAKDFAAHVSPGKLEFWRALGPIVMGKRYGIYFEDAYTHKRYINCHVNGGCYNLGHANAAVSDAVRNVIGTLDIGNHHFVSSYRAEFARRLSATTGDRLARVVFAVGGGEAADLAIKVARARTGRVEVVSALGGYHGHTGLALATGDAKFRDRFGPNPRGYRQVPWDDLAAMDAAIGDQTAAVILEAIPATLGMTLPSDGYFARVRQLCSDRGAMLLVDEVQTGLGRTGKLWGHQHEGIVPDAIISGKGLSGGIYPIAATLMTEDLHAPLNADPFVHISTYGGAEIGCVAGLAVLDQVEVPGFLARVTALGERFERELSPLPLTLRRRGMFMGLKFADSSASLTTWVQLMANGVFAFPAGNDSTVLQFLPPMIISDDEATDLIARVHKSVAR